jgi:hypothetical protein
MLINKKKEVKLFLAHLQVLAREIGKSIKSLGVMIQSK